MDLLIQSHSLNASPPPLRGRCPAGAEGGAAMCYPLSLRAAARPPSGATRHLPRKGGGELRAACQQEEPWTF